MMRFCGVSLPFVCYNHFCNCFVFMREEYHEGKI